MAKNVSSNPRECVRCGQVYIPSSNRQKYCVNCAILTNRDSCREYRARTFVKKGYDQAAEHNNNWKGGIGWYKRHYSLEGKVCEWCGSSRNVVRHHKDHCRYHNDDSNIVYVCRSCHMLHHLKAKKEANASQD